MIDKMSQVKIVGAKPTEVETLNAFNLLRNLS